MLTRTFFQVLSIASRVCSASLWRWFPSSTRTEGQTNLGHCAYVSVTQYDLWYVGWNSKQQEMSLERYLQGRKLEHDVSLDTLEEPRTWTSDQNYLEERNFL